MLFVLLIPHAEVEHDSREESTLCSTQEEPCCKESVKALSETHEGADDTESGGQEPHSWGGEFEDDITWDIEQVVANRIDGQVLVSSLIWITMRRISVDNGERAYSLYVCGEAFNAGISN